MTAQPFPALSSPARRRGLRRLLAAAALCAGAGSAAWAQAPAGRPITLVVPFAAGGGIDAVARQVAVRLAAHLGQTVIVENVAGAFGTIGTQKVARSAPDGQTLLFVVSSPLNVAPLLTPGAVRYDAFKDFAPIATVGMLPFALVGRNELAADSLAALIRLARAQPGKLAYGTDGTGSLLHITGELIQQRAGIELLHVPYKAAPQVLNDIAGGQLDLGILPVALVQGLVQAGRVRAFGVTSTTRLAALPQVPSLAENAGLGGLALESWMGLLAPAATPPAVLERLTSGLQKVAAMPEMEAMLSERGIRPRVVSAAAFEALLRQEREQIAQVITKAGLKPE